MFFHPLHRIPEVLVESGPDKAVQERGGGVGLGEHPAEEVPGAEEDPGEVRDENLEVRSEQDLRGISTVVTFSHRRSTRIKKLI